MEMEGSRGGGNLEESDSNPDSAVVAKCDAATGGGDMGSYGGGGKEPSRSIVGSDMDPGNSTVETSPNMSIIGAIQGKLPALPSTRMESIPFTNILPHMPGDSSDKNPSSDGKTTNKAHKVTPQTGSMESPNAIPETWVGKISNTGSGDEPLLLSSSTPTNGPIAPNMGSSTPESKADASANERTRSPPTSRQQHKKGVPHVYRDFALAPDTAETVRKKTGGVTQPFPEKLHTMLDQEDDPTIVSWLPHGRAFLVRKPLEFTYQIMPKYFRQSKLTSFQRQLNLYGFRRITQGADAGAYYHELFLRGRPQLCLRMQRQKVKGTGHKQPADVQTEPNFYVMPPSQGQPSPLNSPEQSALRDRQPTPAQSVAERPSDPATAAAIPPFVVTTNTSHHIPLEELSPGLRGVHGAAHLLQGISAGVMTSSLDVPFSLGEVATNFSAAASSYPNPLQIPPSKPLQEVIPSLQDSHGSQTASRATDSAFASQQTSLPLLARVTNVDDCDSSAPPTSSPNAESTVFLWPPVRKGIMPGALSAELQPDGVVLESVSKDTSAATTKIESGEPAPGGTASTPSVSQG